MYVLIWARCLRLCRTLSSMQQDGGPEVPVDEDIAANSVNIRDWTTNVTAALRWQHQQ
jgi:hypothetical protein